MSTIAIGDIHGHRPALENLLSKLASEVTEGDTVVFLGDYLDRGPDSKGCIDAILDFRQWISAEVVCLLGNHEDWLLGTRRDYRDHSWLLGMDGLTTIRSYSVDAEQILRDAMAGVGASLLYDGHAPLPYEAFFDRIPPEHLSFLKKLRLYHQTADCVCAHGGLDPRVVRLDEQKRQALIWGAGTFPDGYQGSEVVVYGHWNDPELDRNGWPSPRVIGNTIGIDTIAFGVLTAVRLPDRQVFQSDQYDCYV